MTEPKKPQPYRLGVDIGGTFTDVVVTTKSGGLAVRKILSTPEDYAKGVIAGARAALADPGIPAEGASEVVHATTVATNAILERAGARCALITTAGFRDVLEIGRLRIPELFNPFYDKRPVLVPRDRIIEVDAEGKIVWSVTNEDLGEKLFNDACGAQRLPNGNTVISSYHAKGNQVKLFEVTREKKVVWRYTGMKAGFHHFQILTTNGKPLADNTWK